MSVISPQKLVIGAVYTHEAVATASCSSGFAGCRGLFNATPDSSERFAVVTRTCTVRACPSCPSSIAVFPFRILLVSRSPPFSFCWTTCMPLSRMCRCCCISASPFVRLMVLVRGPPRSLPCCFRPKDLSTPQTGVQIDGAFTAWIVLCQRCCW